MLPSWMVGQRQAVAREAARHLDDMTEMRHHQLAGCIEVVLVVVADGELVLFLSAEHGRRIDRLQISCEPPCGGALYGDRQ